MAVNVKLLKKVRKLIAEEPKRLRMAGWGVQRTKEDVRIFRDEFPRCGTQACLAGWTILAARPSIRKRMKPRMTLLGLLIAKDKHPGIEAAKLLGIPREECPFDKIHWGIAEVLAWIDRQIDAATK